jgi:Cu+-exporting ATPase
MHTLTDTVCYHCGDSCPSEPVMLVDKPFCCEGCKTVYQLLEENGLCTYYDLEKNPGITLKGRKQDDRFAYLDVEEIASRLIDYQDEEQLRITLYLPQIHCSSCIWLLENLHKLHPGIAFAQVNFVRKELYVSIFKEKISLRQLVELLAGIGYEPHISLEDYQKSGNRGSRINKRLIYQLGIAGFCFGNIMMLSFPEYLSLDNLADGEFVRLFGYLNLALIIPALFYSGIDYLKSAWHSLRHGGLNIDVPISLGMLTLFSRSAYEIVTHTGAGYLDSLAGLIFFLLVGKWFQSKTHERLSFERDYASYFPVAISKINEEDEIETVPLANLEEGDVIRVRNQELVPADAVLLSDFADIDYSFVTGEEEPQRRQKGDLIYAGGRQVGQSVELRLAKAVSQSYLTRLWNDEAFRPDRQVKSANLADRMGRYFTFAILIVGVIAGIYWGMTESVGMAVNVFTAVLIVACPCALALTTPFTLGNAMRQMARFGLFLKHPSVVENMASVDTLIFDKTGTLTESGISEAELREGRLTTQEQAWVKSMTQHSGHPASRAITRMMNGARPVEVLDYRETVGKGLEAVVDGHALKLGSSSFMGMEKKDELGGSWLSIDGELKGRFVMPRRRRAGVTHVLNRLASRYDLGLLSGDNTSEKIHWEGLFPDGEKLHFSQSPHEKLAHIKAMEEQGKQVMMLGDGLNDAGALMQSSVGIAVTEDINNFSPACDGMLQGNSFDKLDRFLSYSRQSLGLVRAGFVFSLLYNTIGLGFAVQGLLSPIVAAILMPLSSITIIVFAVVSTTIFGRTLNAKSHSHS